jgi:hypothetical protein
LAVEEVPGVVGLVAEDDVLVLVLVGVVPVGVLDDDEVVLEVVVVVEVVVVEVLLLLEVVQSRTASWLTVPAPWLRFCDSVVLIVEGRLVTALVSAEAALAAGPH